MQLDSIGKFISEQRKKKGLTQKELGEILNIDNRIISKNKWRKSHAKK